MSDFKEKFYVDINNFKNILKTLENCIRKDKKVQDYITCLGIMKHFCLVFDLSLKIVQNLDIIFNNNVNDVY